MSSEIEDFLFDAYDAASTAAGCLEAAVEIMETEGYSDDLVTEVINYQSRLDSISRRLEEISYYKKEAA